MARGVDIPEVDWVIQFDPPSSAKYDQILCKVKILRDLPLVHQSINQSINHLVAKRSSESKRVSEGPHWWEASAVTTLPSLPLKVSYSVVMFPGKTFNLFIFLCGCALGGSKQVQEICSACGSLFSLIFSVVLVATTFQTT